MSDDITDAATHLQRNFDKWSEREREIESFLSKLTKMELLEELCKREGVKEIVVPLEHTYCLNRYSKQFGGFCGSDFGDGAVTIIVVR